MKKHLLRPTLVAGAVILACSANAAEIRGLSQPNVIPDRYIVVYKEPSGMQISAQAMSQSMSSRYGARVERQYNHVLRGAVVVLDKHNAQRLANDPDVAYVEADAVVQLDGTQNNATWGIDRIDQTNLPLSGTYTYPASNGVHAYIIDTGIRASHNEFSGRMSNGYDAIGDGQGTNDCQGHGTHVAGTVGGTTYGVAKDVTLHAVRVLNCQGSGTNSGVIAGMDWVAQNAQFPAVANMSLGGGASQAVDDAVARLTQANVVTVVAAGNDSGNACSYSPARAASAITVGSTTSSDGMSSFSNYGSCVDIFAPGSSILSAGISSNSSTATLSGTSMASPHVAGAAALYLAQNPSANVTTVTNALVNNSSANKISGIPSGPNKLLSTVFLNGGTTPPPPPPPPPGGNALTNGVPVTGLSGNTGAEVNYTMAVPANASNLSFAISGGTGDADMYVKFGSAPTTSSYDCRPYLNGNNETCNISSAQVGTYYVMLRGYTAYSGVSLVGNYTGGGTPPPPPPGGSESEPNNSTGQANTVANGSTTNGTMGSSSDTDYFKLVLPAGATLTATLTPNGSSDYDLYVYNSNGTQIGRSVNGSGQVDSVTVTNTGSSAFTRYIRVVYYSGNTGSSGTYTIKAQH